MSLVFPLALLCAIFATFGQAQTVFDAATCETVPPALGVWSNGEAALSLAEAGDAASGRVLRVRSAGKATALTIARETPLDGAWFGGRTNEWFASFDEILVRKPDPLGGLQPSLDDPEYVAAMAHLGRTASAAADGAKGAMRDDFDVFAVRTLEAYADAVLSLMREFFPGKLIGSNRFLGGATEEMYRCWRGYDFIAVNTYPMMVRGDAVFTDRQMEALRLAHRATGRPVLLTEWGVQALDVRMQSPSAQLRTQAERGRGYGKALRQIVENLPFVAGVVDFGFQNLADSEGQGWGLVDNEGLPYRDYIRGVLDGARWLDGFLMRRSP